MGRFLLWASLLAVAGARAAAQDRTEQIFSRTEASVFTIEIHSGNQEAKSSLGSGYLVSTDGKVVTNYHVVSAHIEEPAQKFIRVRNAQTQRPAELLAFDVANDLALLKVEGITAKPLPISTTAPGPGSAIVALGNPHGLRLSIVEGIFNGYAEKGLVDRMVLSMPLNSGMSGGPILNEKGEVIGTNVAIYRSSNSLSFGVPASKLASLMERRPLPKTADAFRKETHRQLLDLDSGTTSLLKEKLTSSKTTDTVTVGGAELPRPPSIFECWETSKKYEEAGVTRARYRCDLQFAPSVEEDEEVGAVEIEVEHATAGRNRYGFYGWLSEHGSSDLDLGIDGSNGRRTTPQCAVERVAAGALHFKVNTCLTGYVEHDGIYDFGLAATTLDRPREAITVGLQIKGFRREAFLFLSRWILESIRFSSKPAKP